MGRSSWHLKGDHRQHYPSPSPRLRGRNLIKRPLFTKRGIRRNGMCIDCVSKGRRAGSLTEEKNL